MIPCETCLKAAICRYKDYHRIFRDCRDLANILYHKGIAATSARKSNYDHDIRIVEKCLKPTKWKIHV